MDEDDEDMPEHPLEPPGRVKRSSAFRDFPGGDGTRYTKKQKRKQNLEAASFIELHVRALAKPSLTKLIVLTRYLKSHSLS